MKSGGFKMNTESANIMAQESELAIHRMSTKVG